MAPVEEGHHNAIIICYVERKWSKKAIAMTFSIIVNNQGAILHYINQMNP